MIFFKFNFHLFLLLFQHYDIQIKAHIFITIWKKESIFSKINVHAAHISFSYNLNLTHRIMI